MNNDELLRKKKIAALTGVLYYLKNEELEKERSMQMRQETQSNYVSPWAAYNRQSIMQMRGFTQRGQYRKRF